MNTRLFLVCAATSSLLLAGCATTGSNSSGSTFAPAIFGHSRTVSIVDSSDRNKLDTKISLSDIIAFAENLTNKMLASPVIAKAKKPPRIVVGTLRQNTHDENLRVGDIQDRIQEVLFNSGAVRVLDSSANNFDYIMRAEITDIVQRAPDGGDLTALVMQLHGLEDDDGIAAAGIHVQVHGGTHHLRHVHGAVDRTGGIRGQGDMLRPDAQGNGLGRHLAGARRVPPDLHHEGHGELRL